MFLSFLGLGILALEIGERNVKRLVPEADWMIFIDATSANFRLADKPGLVAPCAFPSTDRTGQSTSLLVSRSPYCWGNDSHPPPSALYKAIRFVVTAVWLCAKRSSFP
jgi:hypothetical protein